MAKTDTTLKKARVLRNVEIDGKTYAPNDVVEVDEGTLFDLRGALDADPQSVAAAQNIQDRKDRRAQLEAELHCLE